MINKGVFFLIFFLIFLNSVHAYVGLNPPRYYQNFEPGKQYVYTFNFITDEDRELEIYVDGDLAKYATLSTDRIQGSEPVNVLVEFPDKIDLPGEHIIYVGARQINDPNSNGISVSAEVRGTIRIFVPYPGKYATMKFNTFDTKVGLPVNFSLQLNNEGTEDIDSTGKIQITDEKDKILEEIPVSDWILDSKQSNMRYYSSSNNTFKQGKYYSKAILDYEGGTLKANQTFRIGDLAMSINQYTRYLIKNKLNRFDVEVESLWNDPIDNVYANVSIEGYPISFSTTSANFAGFQALNLTGYFDTSIIKEDTVNADIMVHFGKRIVEKNVKLRFKGTIDFGLVALIGGLVLAVLVILLLTIWIVKLEKMKNGNKNKKSRK